MSLQSNPVPYQKIVFICTNRREEGAVCCSQRGSQELREILKRYVKENGLIGKVRVSQSGCLDLCAKGPNLMIFPDNVWFQNVQPDDLPVLIRRYLDPLKEPPSV